MPEEPQPSATEWRDAVATLAEEVAQAEAQRLREKAPPAAVEPAPVQAGPAAVAEILIFDEGDVGTEAGRRLRNLGYSLTLARPGDDLAEVIGERRITSAVINLALPNGWGTVRRLRNLKSAPLARLYAYALGPNSTTGLWLGPIDFFFLAVDETNLADIVRRLSPPANRVLALTGDPSTLGEVQELLDAGRMTMRTAVTTKQVETVVPEFRPQVVAIHLTPDCFTVFQALRTLRSQKAYRDIPVLFLLAPAAQPKDVALFSAGLRILAEEKASVPELASQLCYQLKLNAHRTA